MILDPTADLKEIVNEQDKEEREEREEREESLIMDGYGKGLQAAIEVLCYAREAHHRTETERNLIKFLINEISELMK